MKRMGLGIQGKANAGVAPQRRDPTDPTYPADQNRVEANAIRDLPGGYGGSFYEGLYDPDADAFYSDMTRDLAFRNQLIDKIKKGVQGCCQRN